MKKEILRLKRELGNVSAQDDFARWAKLRRQHDKVMAQYEKSCKNCLFLIILLVSDIMDVNSLLDTKFSSFIRPSPQYCSMAFLDRLAYLYTILVCETTYILDTERMATILCGVGLIISKGTTGECEHQRVVSCLCKCYKFG